MYPQSIVQPVGNTDGQVSEGTDTSGQSGVEPSQLDEGRLALSRSRR